MRLTDAFRSRNRDAFGFKDHYLEISINHLLNQCFNLVIEVLLVSSRLRQTVARHLANTGLSFNLVIEVLLISSTGFLGPNRTYGKIMFPSRNRGSFDFKTELVRTVPVERFTGSFQSRNRGSFGFKTIPVRFGHLPILSISFDLVIEVLLISRIPVWQQGYPGSGLRFHLVIEVLLISRQFFIDGDWGKYQVSIS